MNLNEDINHSFGYNEPYINLISFSCVLVFDLSDGYMIFKCCLERDENVLIYVIDLFIDLTISLSIPFYIPKYNISVHNSLGKNNNICL